MKYQMRAFLVSVSPFFRKPYAKRGSCSFLRSNTYAQYY